MVEQVVVRHFVRKFRLPQRAALSTRLHRAPLRARRACRPLASSPSWLPAAGRLGRATPSPRARLARRSCFGRAQRPPRGGPARPCWVRSCCTELPRADALGLGRREAREVGRRSTRARSGPCSPLLRRGAPFDAPAARAGASFCARRAAAQSVVVARARRALRRGSRSIAGAPRRSRSSCSAIGRSPTAGARRRRARAAVPDKYAAASRAIAPCHALGEHSAVTDRSTRTRRRTRRAPGRTASRARLLHAAHAARALLHLPPLALRVSRSAPRLGKRRSASGRGVHRPAAKRCVPAGAHLLSTRRAPDASAASICTSSSLRSRARDGGAA